MKRNKHREQLDQWPLVSVVDACLRRVHVSVSALVLCAKINPPPTPIHFINYCGPKGKIH